LLSSAYLAPTAYYAYLYAAREVTEDRGEFFQKQTYRNRCYIATPQGALSLTIPVVRDELNHCPMRNVRISDHGNWRHIHWNALVSAYEKTPYFFYYADDLRPLYEKPFTYLVDFNEALQQTVLSLLALTPRLQISNTYVTNPPANVLDLRQSLSPKVKPAPTLTFEPYYQVFAPRTGFLPNLSILDLLFNLGAESRMVLKSCLA